MKQKIFRVSFKSEEPAESNDEEKRGLVLGNRLAGQPGSSLRSSRRFLSLKKPN